MPRWSLALLAVLWVVTSVTALAAPSRVLDARVGSHPDKTRFVIELSEPVAFRLATESAARQVAIDLPDTQWSGSAAAQRGGGLVERFRVVPAGDGAIRVILDTRGPTRIREAFLIPPREGRLSRLVVDLEAGAAPHTASPAIPAVVSSDASSKAEARTAARGTAPVAFPPPPPPPFPVRSAAIPATTATDVLPSHNVTSTSAGAPIPAAASSPAPTPAPAPVAARVTPVAAVAMVPPIPPPSPARRPVVVIDPGHGGADPGAIGINGVHEKIVTLDMAQELKRQLLDSGRYQVVLTRDRDEFVRLRERVARGRAAGADLFISLHADSIATDGIRGLSIYTLSDKASDREAEQLAAKENRVDAIAGVDLSSESDQVASILIDLAQRDTQNNARRFANVALRELGRDVKLLPKPQRAAGFAVLTAADVPSVLVEMGYMSSPTDATLLTQQDHREKLANALKRGIDNYFQWRERVRRL